MKKILLLLCTLLGTVGAWADVTVTLADASVDPYTYGTRSNSNQTFTSNAASGLEGVVLDVTGAVDHYSSGTYGGRLALKTSAASADETWTLTAPEGYLIKGYSFSARAAGSYTATITADGTEYNVTSDETYTNVAVSDLKVKTTSFTVNASAANWIAIGPFTVTLAKIDFISLTFDKPGSATDNITVNVKDADGDAIPGVTASLESTSCTEFKTGSSEALSRTTNSVLAPNAGYANSQGATITYTFKVEGLPTTFIYNKAALDVYALTGGGASQGNTGTTVREWTFDVETGTAADALTSFVSQVGNDICTVEDADGGLYHKLWTMSGSDKAATDALYIKVTLTKTASLGCFAGIGEVQLYKPGATVQYVISDANGTVFTSDVLNTTEGDVITELPAAYQRSYCNYSDINQTMVAGENTVNVTVTYNLPFTVSPDFENAVWYYATIRDSKYLRADDENMDGSGRYATNSTNEKTDAYKWAFFGSPYSYFYIANKGQGEGKYLNAGSVPTFETIANPASTDAALWEAISNGAGFTLRSITGTNLYLNDAGNGGNLGYWNSTSGRADDGSRWKVDAVPALTVDVTYELYVGGSKVNTVVDEAVAANSEVAVPTSLITGYSSLGYDFATSGTIGEEDCTITVTGTLKSGIVTDVASLSNNKTYKLNSARGYLATYNGTTLASEVKTSLGVSAAEFAIISNNDNLYLYSVADKKYVQTDGSLSTYPTDAVLTIANEIGTSPVFALKYGSNYINSSSGYDYGFVINSWGGSGKWDDGNQYVIEEADAFSAEDLATALVALTDRTPYFEALNGVITLAQGMTFGTGLGEYTKGADYDTALSAAQTTYANGDASQSALEEAAQTLTTAITNCVITQPAGKFVRLHNAARGVYLGTAASGKHPNAASIEDAGIYYVTGDNKIISIDQAAYLGSTAGAPCVLAGSAGTFTFSDAGSGKYYVNCGGYLVAWTSASDRLSSADEYAVWTITEVEDFKYNVTISAAGYATLCFPVALTIPTGVTANTVAINSDGVHLDLTAISGTTIPAGTPVLLEGEADTYTFALNQENTDDALASPDWNPWQDCRPQRQLHPAEPGRQGGILPGGYRRGSAQCARLPCIHRSRQRRQGLLLRWWRRCHQECGRRHDGW